MQAGMRKAKVALARKLAVILHRMLADHPPFTPAAGARTAPAAAGSGGGLAPTPDRVPASG